MKEQKIFETKKKVKELEELTSRALAKATEREEQIRSELSLKKEKIKAEKERAKREMTGKDLPFYLL
jgi:hypothetical protein